MLKLFSLFMLFVSLNLYGIVNYDPLTNTYTIDSYGADFKPKVKAKHNPFEVPKELPKKK